MTTLRAFRLFSTLVFMSLLIAGCASLIKPKLKQQLVALKPGDYQLDPAHSTVLFKVDHMGYSKFVGRFNRVDASLLWNAESIEASQLEAIVDMASVDVNNPKFERALNGRFWFDTQTYPQATFKTLSAEKVGANQMRFLGELFFMGVAQEIEVDVLFNGAANNWVTGKYTLGFSASSTISRSAFGLDRFVPAVGDEVELEIHAEFH